MGAWILLFVPLVAVGAGRHRLLKLRGRAGAAWSQLEAQLSRRRELTQSLLDLIEERSESESEAAALACFLQRARDATDIPARAEAENGLSRALRRSCDRLADEVQSEHSRVRSLLEELSSLETQTAFAVRSYNQQVMAWNQSLHRFRFIAGLGSFQPIEYFVLDDP